MFRSLRFRLPALFLIGIGVSGLIAAVLALRLFQNYVLDRSKAQLRREAIGLTEVFAGQARKYLGVARPLRLDKNGPAFGDLIVATPKTELTQRWMTLLERLAVASLG